MDGSTIAAFATTATALVGGALAILKILVDRHLAALTRLEARAEANTDVQGRIALAFDAVRDNLVNLDRSVDRIGRGVTRLLDAAGLTETESVPMPPPPEVPRAAAITGQHRAIRDAGPVSGGGASRPPGEG